MQDSSSLDLWILAGQSNMQGCGLLAGSHAPDDRVEQLSMSGEWCLAQEPLHPLWESYAPIHQNLMRGPEETRTNEEIARADREARTGGSGLGLAFGRAWADSTGRRVGLIPCAHGGTSLAQWDFRLKDEGVNSLYGAMLDRVKKARELHPNARLAGILWYQGESDSGDGPAQTYAARLDEWIGQMRADLGAPELPFLAVQIGNVTRAPGDSPEAGWQSPPWQQVRYALGEVAQRVPRTAATTAVDLGLTDTIHIDTPGLIRLGERLAKCALALYAGGGQIGPHVRHIEKMPHPLRVRVVCDGVHGTWPDRIAGFGVRTPEGAVHPQNYVIAAMPAADNPRDIELLLNLPPDDSIQIGYALTLDGFHNAADSADLPLMAFPPLPVR